MDGPAARNTEALLRAEIAACTLLLNHEGILGYSGHVSARLPGRDAILIQSFDQSRAAVAPGDLLVVGLDGEVIEGPDGIRPPSEVHIHTEILKARPDVHAVAHFHPETATLFTLADGPQLAPVKNHAARWANGIPVHPDPAHIDTPALGCALADTLGDCHAALIRAHGVVVTAEDVRALLIDCIHFEENAAAMYGAAMLGPVKPLTAAETDAFLASFNRPRHVAKLWQYYAGRGRAAGVLDDEFEGVV